MCNNLIKKGFKEHKSGLWVSRDGEVYVPKSGTHNEHYTYGGTMNSGYLVVKRNGKQYLVHRLVAECFIDNPNDYKEVNHKDEDKTNNCVANLEWCDRKYNMNFGTRTERAGNSISKVKTGVFNTKISKTVTQYDLEGNLIRSWPSAAEVHRALGFSKGNISSCCRGKFKTAYKYIWKYA